MDRVANLPVKKRISTSSHEFESMAKRFAPEDQLILYQVFGGNTYRHAQTPLQKSIVEAEHIIESHIQKLREADGTQKNFDVDIQIVDIVNSTGPSNRSPSSFEKAEPAIEKRIGALENQRYGYGNKNNAGIAGSHAPSKNDEMEALRKLYFGASGATGQMNEADKVMNVKRQIFEEFKKNQGY